MFGIHDIFQYKHDLKIDTYNIFLSVDIRQFFFILCTINAQKCDVVYFVINPKINGFMHKHRCAEIIVLTLFVSLHDKLLEDV